MHILVIPSEEFVPDHAPMAGIFQRHQIDALRLTGNEKIGVLSVRLRYSIPMYIKTLALRMLGRKAGNALDATKSALICRSLMDGITNHPRLGHMTERAGVPVAAVESPYLAPPTPLLDPIWWCRAGALAFNAYCGKYGMPDVVHAHNVMSAGLLARRLKEQHGIPYVLTEHSSYFWQGLVPRRWFGQVSRVIEDASSFSVVSRALARSIEDRIGPLPREAEVIGNVLPTEFEAAAQRHKNCDGFTFLAVGSLLPIKNHALLLNAMAATLQCLPASRLRIVGDGPMRAELEAEAVALGIAYAVTFVGQCDQHGVRREMLSADALVFPSHFETFGVTLIEAMSCGLPVIAIASGGPQEIVTESTGVLLQAGDGAGLVAAMCMVIEERERFDSDAIRQYAIDNWGHEVFCKRLRRLYFTAAVSRAVS